MPETEERLTEQAVRGDRGALQRLLYQCDADVRDRIALKMSRKHRRVLDVDDILQATYLDAALSVSQFRYRAPGSFLGWLMGIAHTTLIDAIRFLEAEKRPNERRRIEPGSDESYDRLIAALAGPSSTPSGRAVANERRARLDAAIADLPEDYRKLIRWYDLRGLTAKEVGRRIGKSPAAVYVMRPRAHAHLARLLHRSDFFSTVS